MYVESIQKCVNKSLLWIENNSLIHTGIIVNSDMLIPYPEVTGYYIPTLLTWNDEKRAISYSRWLCSIQEPNGAWGDPTSTIDCIFDTGQIMRGLLSIYELTKKEEVKKSLLKACKWLLSQIDDNGVIHAPDIEIWDNTIPDTILLYALEPILRVSKILGEEQLTQKSNKAVKVFLSRHNLIEFSCLSHFHAYIIEALYDLGYKEKAKEGMKIIEKLQKNNGFLPAYKNKKWVCSTALFQYSIIWYKLGEIERANKSFEYAISLQNTTGGWYGSYGRPYRTLHKLGKIIPYFKMYFPKSEISWAVKYALDATFLYLKANDIKIESIQHIHRKRV